MMPALFTLNAVPEIATVGALPFGNSVSVLRMLLAPLMSSRAEGAVVPMPTFNPDWKSDDLSMMFLAVQSGT